MHKTVLIRLNAGDTSACEPNFLDKVRQLEVSAEQAGVAVIDMKSPQGVLDALRGHLPCIPVVSGIATLAELMQMGSCLAGLGLTPVMPVDAISVFDSADKRFMAKELSRHKFHIALTDAVTDLFESKERYVYAYPKPDVSASLLVLLKPSNRVVLVCRKFEPFQGSLCIPGGFLNPLSETLEECATREFYEETGMRLSAQGVKLLSVQSNPGRDPRGHVINHTFWAAASDNLSHQFIAGDDAESVELVPLSKALNMPLAADCGLVLSELQSQLIRSNRIARPRFGSLSAFMMQELTELEPRVRPS